MPEDRAWSSLGLAGVSGWTEGPGLVASDKAGPLLNRAVDALWGRLRDQLSGLERSSVIERALLNYAAIETDRRGWRLTAAALLALYDDTRDIVHAANDRETQRSVAGLASRVIAEMALCTSPLGGGSTCTRAELDRLVAEVATLLGCAGQSDALRYELASGDLVVHPNGSFEFDTTYAMALHEPYMQAHGERGFRAAAAGYGALFEIGSSGGGSVDPIFEVAFRDEFKIGLHDFYEFAMKITDEALTQGCHNFVFVVAR